MDIFPTSVEVSLSEEGLNYAPPVILRNDVSREEGARVKEFDVHIGSAQARFVRSLPEYRPLSRLAQRRGGKAWLFVDEIVVRTR